MASMDENIQLDSEFTYQQYAPPVTPNITNISGTSAAGVVTTIDGDAGAGAVGPIVTFSGGTTGFGFTAVGTSVTLTGAGTAVVPVASGGTGATTAAAARSNLSVPLLHTAIIAPAITDDGAAGYPIGSLWVDTVLKNGFMSVDASAGAAVWKQIT